MRKLFATICLIFVAWLSASPVAAADPFAVQLKFDELRRPVLFWSPVEGAAKYCVRDAVVLVRTWERCTESAGLFKLYEVFDGEVDKDSKFTVFAIDKDGKVISEGIATSEVASSGVVVAVTEFGDFSNLGDYAARIMLYALPVGIALAVIMSVYAGIRFMLSQGQPDKIKDAQEILQGAVLGLIVLIMTRFFVNFLFVPQTNQPATEPVTEQAEG